MRQTLPYQFEYEYDYDYDRDDDRSSTWVSGTAGLVGGLLLGLAAGALIMYMADPLGGGRRRAFVRDKSHRYVRRTQEQVRRRMKDARNRAQGMVHDVRTSIRRESVDDHTLSERVRSAMGRVVSHSHSIGVNAFDGVVTLTGPILAHEVDELCDTVQQVRGVRGVVNHLDVYEDSGNVPGLQP